MKDNDTNDAPLMTNEGTRAALITLMKRRNEGWKGWKVSEKK